MMDNRKINNVYSNLIYGNKSMQKIGGKELDGDWKEVCVF